MHRTPVKSSNVKSIGYDAKEKLLEIEFVGGEVYKYLNVPEDVYIKLIKAPSIGSAIHSFIRGKYTYTKG